MVGGIRALVAAVAAGVVVAGVAGPAVAAVDTTAVGTGVAVGA